MPNIGVPELVIILVILLLLFGAKKLPELAKSLGSSARELRHGLRDEGQDDGPKSSNKKS